MPLTFARLAAIIASMTPEEQQKNVVFLESYDDYKIVDVSLSQTHCEVEDSNGNVIHMGEWYLW